MSSLTTNLKLVKPELQDNITPTIFADNFDKIDAALEGVSGGALSLEEIEASTNLDGKIPSAAALKEVNNSLVASDGQKLYFDSKDGKYGYNTDPNRGADTFVPFKSGELHVYSKQVQGQDIVNPNFDSDNLKIIISSSSEITTKPVFNGVVGKWEKTDVNILNYNYEVNYKNVKITDTFNLSLNKYRYKPIFIQY